MEWPGVRSMRQSLPWKAHLLQRQWAGAGGLTNSCAAGSERWVQCVVYRALVLSVGCKALGAARWVQSVVYRALGAARLRRWVPSAVAALHILCAREPIEPHPFISLLELAKGSRGGSWSPRVQQGWR